MNRRDFLGTVAASTAGMFAGLALFEDLKRKEVQVILIDRNNFHQFQPLFFQVATCGLEPDSITFPFRKQIKGDFSYEKSNRVIIRNFKPSPSVHYTKK